MRRNLVVPVFWGLLLYFTGAFVWAQEVQEPMSPPPIPEAQVPKQTWSTEELNNLVAPVALYPDPLLGQMLVASTYPLEVVEASQWLQHNRNLSGRALVDAAKEQPWDPSVQALVAVPDALAQLNRDIGWTTELGNAFLAQQAEVMSAVQQMRTRAQANGVLRSTPQQTVRMEDQGGQQAVVIEPADPQVIYVPYYDPMYVWGPPVWGYYPPLYYPRWGFGFGIGYNLGFCFADWGGWGYWGWAPNWYGRTVFVNNYFFPRYGFHYGYHGGYGRWGTWVHNPEHRFGVPYGNRRVSDRFERASIASRNSFRPRTTSNFASASNRNSYAGRFSGRAPDQGFRSAANPQRTYPAQRYQAPQQYRSAIPQQRSSYPQQYRNTVPQQSYSSRPQYRAAPQQSRPAMQSYAPRSNRSFGGGGSYSRGGGSFSRGGGGGGGRSSSGGGGRHR